MKQFDYESAWEQMARPEYDARPAEARALIDSVTLLAAELRQKDDLTMPWPEGKSGEALKRNFERLDDETLARWACVVYAYGHWMPGYVKNERGVQSTGAYWKFSHYADQVLRARLGLVRDPAPLGLSYAVHEGELRMCHSTQYSWTWECVGWATRENYARCKEQLGDGYMPELAKKLCATEDFLRLTDLSPFTREVSR